ncbi:MAG: ankyrin repeat domain-containing protein [Gemmatimonadales bacterium]
MSRVLPEHPDLEHLRGQAKALLQMLRDGQSEAAERFRSVGVDAVARLSEAQHVVAREYGFPSWAKLKAHVESRVAEPAQALILAVKAHDADRVRAIVARHPSIRTIINRGTDELGFGATPLIAAVQQSDRAMIDALLAAGADIAVKSDWWAGGFSVLETASEETVPFLLERGAVLEPCSAAKFGTIDRLAGMVATDPTAVHARGGDGKTPLHWAKDVATARFLVNHGADVNARDVDHESTPIQYMARDRQEIVRYLIAQGAEADIFAAAAIGDLPLATRILDANPDAVEMVVNGTSFPMANPRAGGIIYIWTLGNGKTPHTVAQEFEHPDVYDLLMSRSPDQVKLAQACLLGDEKLFERFLADHPDITAQLTPAMRQQIVGAAVNNNTSAVRLMLRAGWPADVRGPHGGTPLHWSAWHGNLAMMREILRHHPPLDLRDNAHNIPPLGWALHGSLHGWHAKDGDFGGVVTALIEAGAKTDNPPPLPTMEGSDAALAAYRRGAGRR